MKFLRTRRTLQRDLATAQGDLTRALAANATQAKAITNLRGVIGRRDEAIDRLLDGKTEHRALVDALTDLHTRWEATGNAATLAAARDLGGIMWPDDIATAVQAAVGGLGDQQIADLIEGR